MSQTALAESRRCAGGCQNLQVSRWHLSLSDSLHIVTCPDDVCQLQLPAVCTDRVVGIDRYVTVFGDMRKLALIRTARAPSAQSLLADLVYAKQSVDRGSGRWHLHRPDSS